MGSPSLRWVSPVLLRRICSEHTRGESDSVNLRRETGQYKDGPTVRSNLDLYFSQRGTTNPEVKTTEDTGHIETNLFK